MMNGLATHQDKKMVACLAFRIRGTIVIQLNPSSLHVFKSTNVEPQRACLWTVTSRPYWIKVSSL